ncbi:hypothetical protein OPV22_026526 [Ensete ventricosum]|uniref:DUF985 domain-containing protein n=1 Tax=Ensete ventricosum TaxID=4639 RepID=A0AAV8QFN6_ENSVE|nr:hypothetical protein OPV22_026526 [Ensete ventricosum]
MGSPKKKASEVAALLDLQPHPDGGFYLETFRDSSITLSKSQLPPQYNVDRAVSSAIYFLLPSGNVAHLHRIPCAETWHFYMGEPLTVFELLDDGQVKLTIIGPELEAGHRPQYTVPPNVWFGAFLTLDVESSPDDGSVHVKTSSRDPELHYSLVDPCALPSVQGNSAPSLSKQRIGSKLLYIIVSMNGAQVGHPLIAGCIDGEEVIKLWTRMSPVVPCG